MDPEQQRRIAENESRYRDLNERVTSAIAEFLGDRGTHFAVMCECAVSECADMIDVTSDQYQHVRSSPRWHIVRPEHIIPAAEQVVEQHEEWWIVEKLGIGAEVAEERA